MGDSDEKEDKVFFDNDGETFNGSFQVESITIMREWKNGRGLWRYCVRIPAEQAEDGGTRQFFSRGYSTPRAAIAALDTQLRPWISLRFWLVAIPVFMFFAYLFLVELG